MKRWGFSLLEILVVIAILAVIAAFLFPAFAQSKERAKITACQARLKQFGLAMNLYRADHEGRGYAFYTQLPKRYPFGWYDPIQSYFKDASPLWCPMPNRAKHHIVAQNFVNYQTWSLDPMDGVRPGQLYRPRQPEGNSVLAYCSNHMDGLHDEIHAPSGKGWPGKYPFVRDDTSVGLADGAALSALYYRSETEWQEQGLPGARPWIRFPNEPWPPKFER